MTRVSRLIVFVENVMTRVVIAFSTQGFDTKRYRFNFPEVWYSPWNEEAEFNALYDEIKVLTLISKRKLFDLYQIGKQVNRCGEGLVLEVGTYRGGSAGLLASVCPARQLILWDIWSKTVEEDHNFVRKVYSDSEDLKLTKKLLSMIKTQSATQVEYVDAIFPNSTIILGWSRPLSLVHFDIYDAGAFLSGIELLWPRLAVGGIFVVGGYGSISLDPLTKAVNHFVKRTDCFFSQSQSGLGLILKRS